MLLVLAGDVAYFLLGDASGNFSWRVPATNEGLLPMVGNHQQVGV